METPSPHIQSSDPIDGQAIFAALRDALAKLYPEERDARVVVDDAGLVATQIAFSPRAQTNWHNILAAALRQNRLDALLQIVRAAYGDNPAFQTADPDLADAFWGRGLAFRHLVKPQAALTDFRRYLELDPTATDRAQIEGWIAELEAELAEQN